MPELVWSKTMNGECPDLALGKDVILCHHLEVHGEKKVARLHCFDLQGCEQWSQPDMSVVLSLPGSRFLVITSDGRPSVIDESGLVRQRWKNNGVERITRSGDLLLFRDKQNVWATTLELEALWQFGWQGKAGFWDAVFSEGAFYWVDGKSLWRCVPGGEPEIFCPLPWALITQSMDEWERATGNSALSGFYSQPGMSDFAEFKRGDRPLAYYWRVAFDTGSRRFFLAHALGPHLILCLDESGQPQWCKYINFGCCGGVPLPLPTGLYVTSSGCGGILSWLDGEGTIVYQSRPHEGVGMATAYSNELEILPDGSCLVDGGPGVVAYSSSGDLLWVLERGYTRFVCEAERRILVGCGWQNNEAKGPSTSFLDFFTGI